MKTRKFETDCDMGGIKIYNDTMSIFFSNNVGDVPNIVIVTDKNKNASAGDFLGHFTVKTEAHLSSYDCDNIPLFTFPMGRWFVYLEKPTQFRIIKVDEDIHA